MKIARNEKLVCDICRRETTRIVGKLQFIPVIPGVSKAVHSNYTHHADVGACCSDKLMRGFNFQKRLTAEQYRKKRRGERVA